jgi:type IV pilus assembly protein PilM
MFNFSKPQSFIGLDVSGSSIKLMQIKKDGKNFAVKAFSRGALPKGALINDVIADQKTFNFVLKQALDKPQFGRFDTQYAVAALPESKSFIRVIQIPKMSDAESEAAVPYEAESFIPMPIDQVYLDWQRIGESNDKSDILIIATPKEYIDSFLGFLDQAGLNPAALETESQSLRRSLISWKDKQTCLIADIDAGRSNLVMVEDSNLQFSSTIPIAGSAFTESLARALGVSSAKSEEIKKKVGLLNTAEYPNVKIALAPILTSINAEINNVLKFHAERSQKSVEKVILAGGGAKLKNLAEMMQSELAGAGNIKVEIGNPWRNLDGIKNQAFSPEESLSWSTAIGLAIRNYEE